MSVVGTVIVSSDGERWVNEGPGAWRFYPPWAGVLSTEQSLQADDVDGFIASRDGDGNAYTVRIPTLIPPDMNTNFQQFTTLLTQCGIPYTVDSSGPGSILSIYDAFAEVASTVEFDVDGNFTAWHNLELT